MEGKLGCSNDAKALGYVEIIYIELARVAELIV